MKWSNSVVIRVIWPSRLFEDIEIGIHSAALGIRPSDVVVAILAFDECPSCRTFPGFISYVLAGLKTEHDASFQPLSSLFQAELARGMLSCNALEDQLQYQLSPPPYFRPLIGASPEYCVLGCSRFVSIFFPCQAYAAIFRPRVRYR
ncbi:unnamed protein product [Somion occarium]|uniref:Uncharacterized protein n=1 Tax=Somion occarium TaxID=3059160 RepID=A0ABP1CF01_9APHY